MEFVRGSTFDFSGPVELTENGAIVEDLSAWTAQSQIRDSAGNLVADLSCELIDPEARILRVVFEGDTADWPLRTLAMDVAFTNGATTVHTQRQTIKVVDRITR